MATPDRAITASVMKNVSMTYAPCDFFTGRPIRPSRSVVFHRATAVQNCSQMKINTGTVSLTVIPKRPQERFGRQQTAMGNQAVWPSNMPVLGIFFSCCGVIVAKSRPPGTPRGPSFLRTLSSSVGLSSSTIAAFISCFLPARFGEPCLLPFDYELDQGWNCNSAVPSQQHSFVDSRVATNNSASISALRCSRGPTFQFIGSQF